MASLDKARREFEEYEVDIVNVVGNATYHRILWEYQRVIRKQLKNKDIVEVVSLFHKVL